MADVFVSYKSEDRDAAARMVAALEASGLSVWWDQHIGTGDVWRSEITEQLDGAKAVVVLWTANSVGREGRFVQEEAQRALHRGAYRPVLLEDVALPLGFSEIQAHFLLDWDGSHRADAFLGLLASVRHMVAHAPPPGGPPSLGPAGRTSPGTPTPAAPRPRAAEASSERRTVTLLRAEFVHGEDGEDDPEYFDELMMRLEERLEELVDGERASLLQLDTDGFSIAVGAERAQEDDELAAARLALLVGDALRTDPGIETRMALVTGLAVVTHRPGLRVTGRLLARAGEMVRCARPGHVLIEAPTARRIGGSLMLEELEDGLHAVTGQGNRGASATPADHASPLIGRQQERDRLLQALSLAEAGQGRAISIIGEPGMGKTRLVHSFLADCAERGAIVGHATCRSHDRTRPHGPFGDILSGFLGLGDISAQDDAAALARERIAERLPDLVDYTPYIMQLTGIRGHGLEDDRAGAGRALVGEAILSAMVALAEHHPVVLLIDDLHLADEATLETLLATAEACASFRILLLCGTRPLAAPLWPAMPHCEQMVLDTLDTSEVEELIGRATGAETVDAELVRLIHRRTDGVPMFVEELTRVLHANDQFTLEQGRLKANGPLEGVNLPRSIDAVVRTRLDSLDTGLRDALRKAAVIGRQFSWAMLRDLIGASGPPGLLLGKAVSLGLLQQVKVGPQAEYRFRQMLTQEVAYDSLLSKQRRELHGRIGEWIERNRADGLETEVEELAHHFLLAEDTEKAIGYHIAAGERAFGWGSMKVAKEMFAVAVQLIETLDPGPQQSERLLNALVMEGNALVLSQGYHSPGMRVMLARVEELADSLPPGDARFAALWWVWRVAYNCDSMDKAREFVAQLQQVAEMSGDGAHRVAALTADGIISHFEGEPAKAVEKLERAAAMMSPDAQRAEGPLAEIAPEVWLDCFLGLASILTGRIASGWEALDRAHARSVELDHPHLECFVLIYVQNAGIALGDMERVREANDRSLVLSRRHDLLHWEISTRVLAGQLKFNDGDIQGGVAALALGEKHAAIVGVGLVLSVELGKALSTFASGDKAGALALLDALEARMDKLSMQYLRSETAWARCMMTWADDPVAARSAALDEAARLAGKGAHLGALRLAARTAKLIEGAGDVQLARDVLAERLEPFAAPACERWPLIADARAQLAQLEAGEKQGA